MSWNGSYASSFEKDLLALRTRIRQQGRGWSLTGPSQNPMLRGEVSAPFRSSSRLPLFALGKRFV